MSNPAPSARHLLDQANALWPNRDKSSDGIIPSAAHHAANPRSDHEVGTAGYNHAVDLTNDPAHGCDTRKVADELATSEDWRIKYVIANRQIWTPAKGWHPYTGTDPHTGHLHLSIVDTTAACRSTADWHLKPLSTARKVLTINRPAVSLLDHSRTDARVVKRLVFGQKVNALDTAPVRGINYDFWRVERIEGARRFVGFIRADYLK